MQGKDLVAWRRGNGYSQDELKKELGIGSRQTISAWENSPTELPRVVELALVALQNQPECRRRAGKKASTKEEREFRRRQKR